LVRPLLAGIGASPHRCANAASDRSRSGLSPAVVSSWPATSVPTPGEQAWRGDGDEGLELGVGFGDLFGEVLVPPEAAQRGLGGLLRCGELGGGAQPRAGCDQHGRAQVA